MAAKTSEVIDLLSADADSVISFPPVIVESKPQQKKIPYFLSLNGQDLQKSRTNDANKGEENPRSGMWRLLHKEDREMTFLFSSYKTKII